MPKAGEAIAVPTAQSARAVAVRGPQVVRYTIQSSLSDVPKLELSLRELNVKAHWTGGSAYCNKKGVIPQ